VSFPNARKKSTSQLIGLLRHSSHTVSRWLGRFLSWDSGGVRGWPNLNILTFNLRYIVIAVSQFVTELGVGGLGDCRRVDVDLKLCPISSEKSQIA